MQNLPVKENQLRVVACPHPFKMANEEFSFAPSISVAQILREVQPDEFLRRKAHIWVNDEFISVRDYETTFPAVGSHIDIRVVPSGGFGRIIGMIFLAIAMIVMAVLLPPLIGPILLGGINITGALVGLAVMAVGIVGNLLLNALFPPSKPSLGGGAADSPTFALSGASNVANLYGPIPKTLGKYRICPNYGARPYTESVGSDQYLHLCFVWGWGPIQVEDLRIGQTPVEDFSGIEMIHKNLVYIQPSGVPSIGSPDSPQPPNLDNFEDLIDYFFAGATAQPVITENYPSTEEPYNVTIKEEALSVRTETGVENIRSSADNADELSVDISCPGGLSGYGTTGVPYPLTVDHQISYRLEGSETWIDAGALTMTDTTKSAVRGNKKWSVTRGKYEIKVVRTTGPDQASQNSVSYWDVLRTISKEDPIRELPYWLNPNTGNLEPRMLAVTLMKIKATGQLSGTVSEFSGIVTSICPDWDIGAMTSIQISAPGTGYVVGDLVLVIQEGASGGIIKVKEVDGSGAVTDFSIWHGGSKYTVANGLFTEETPSGGSGFKIDILEISAGEWVRRTTQNPASLYREAVQGQQCHKPLSNSRLDLDRLQYWHEYCAANQTYHEGTPIAHPWQYNKNVDYQVDTKSLLDEIASSGRAAFAWVDSKLGVIIDEPQTFAKGPAFTPRNILKNSFQATIVYPDMPHAFRCPFRNEEKEWLLDERLVLDDGYLIEGKDAWGNSQTVGEVFDPVTGQLYAEASVFEQIEFAGVTNPDLVFKHGRYHIASARLRPETTQFGADFEWLVATRGDRFKFAHDVMLVGLSWGRVKELVMEVIDEVETGLIAGVITDEFIPMQSDVSYVCRFRLADNTSLLCPVKNNSETVTFGALPTPYTFGSGIRFGQDINPLNEVEFESPINPAEDPCPQIGDLFLFGETDLEATDLIVKSIAPNSDLSATVIAVAYNEAIYDADQGLIPAFESDMTLPSDWWLPIVDDVRSDGTALLRAADGSWISRILLTLYIPSLLDKTIIGVEVRYGLIGSSNMVVLPMVDIHSNEISILPVEDGQSYDYQLRYVKNNGSKGNWTEVATHVVEGKTAPPADVLGFNVYQVSSLITASWAPVPDLDVAGYEIRYGPIGVSWEESYSINGTFRGTTFTTTEVPPGTWDFLIKAIDTSGNYSENAARKTFLVYLFSELLSDVEQRPTWPGTLTNYVRNPATGNLNPDNQYLANDARYDSVDISEVGLDPLFDRYVPDPYAVSSYVAPEIDIDRDGITVRAYARIISNMGPEEAGTANLMLSIDYKLTEGGSYDGYEDDWTIDYLTGRFILAKVTKDNTEGVARLTNFQPVIDIPQVI